jgi:peptidoglycan/LPS O-acetylase OafA/YrhL
MQQSSAPDLPSHIPSLDGLRGLSIALVIFGHAASTNLAPAFLDRPMFTSMGNVGVRFFFVISGFLITTLLMRDIDKYGRIRIKVFYIRRSLRILPAALSYIGVMWLLHVTGVIDMTYHLGTRTNVSSAVPDLIHALTFTANFQHDYNWYFNHLWSLSVEEQFYLVWPLTLVLLGLRRALLAGACVLVAAPVARLLMHTFSGGPEIALSREFQAVADALATGCVFALLHNRLSESRPYLLLMRGGAVPLGLLLLALGYGMAFLWRPSAYLIGQTLSNFGIALFLQYLVRNPTGWLSRAFNWKPLAWVGVLSYSLYLWQEPFLFFASRAWACSFPQNIALAFGAAMASHYLVERPFLKLKDRWAAPTHGDVARANATFSGATPP